MATPWTPAEVISAWTGAVATASLLNKFVVERYLPKVARLVSAIISIPSGHLANFYEDAMVLYRDVTGQDRRAPVAAPVATPTQKEEPKS